MPWSSLRWFGTPSSGGAMGNGCTFTPPPPPTPAFRMEACGLQVARNRCKVSTTEASSAGPWVSFSLRWSARLQASGPRLRDSSAAQTPLKTIPRQVQPFARKPGTQEWLGAPLPLAGSLQYGPEHAPHSHVDHVSQTARTSSMGISSRTTTAGEVRQALPCAVPSEPKHRPHTLPLGRSGKFLSCNPGWPPGGGGGSMH